jgi:bifunctional non-homologous end joining protein LigD
MLEAFQFCIPTKATHVPVGRDWLHEIKYDGYRLRIERDGDRVDAGRDDGISLMSRTSRMYNVLRIADQRQAHAKKGAAN